MVSTAILLGSNNLHSMGHSSLNHRVGHSFLIPREGHSFHSPREGHSSLSHNRPAILHTPHHRLTAIDSLEELSTVEQKWLKHKHKGTKGQGGAYKTFLESVMRFMLKLQDQVV